ncbi:MAG: hypothetical protein KDE48_04965 [Anaerolineales bacterium]|nr:hypothetical protein [Anaerolineales bacterium]
MTVSIIRLRQVLSNYFNESELQDIAFDLGVDYENLPGRAKGDKARELIAYLERRGRISELEQKCNQLRPNAFRDLEVDTLGVVQSIEPIPISASEPAIERYRDVFTHYEIGLINLLAQISQDHPRYGEGLAYQHRLQENLAQTRRLGDTEIRRSERAEIVEQLNELSLSTLGISFNRICTKRTA